MPARTFLAAVAALVAFAANSLFCRMALSSGSIDPATFSLIRFASGAAALAAISVSSHATGIFGGSWVSAIVISLYALPFAVAYAGLTTGTGALILFGSVQLTMMVGAIRAGERPHALHWVGFASASLGLVYLVLPGLAGPPLAAAGLMIVAGISWGIYSLRGRGATNPLLETTRNFIRVVPLLLLANLIFLRTSHADSRGIALAVASGVLASGLGYVVWYVALRGLTAARAAVVQLAVPILAAVAGVLFLGERLTPRLIIASVMVLGGIAIALAGRAVNAGQALSTPKES